MRTIIRKKKYTKTCGQLRFTPLGKHTLLFQKAGAASQRQEQRKSFDEKILYPYWKTLTEVKWKHVSTDMCLHVFIDRKSHQYGTPLWLP